MRIIPVISLFIASAAVISGRPEMRLQKETTIDSLGACQGVSNQDGRFFLYGDREVGVVREYELRGDSLVYQQRQCLFTIGGRDVINHPTGLAIHDDLPVFIGNSIRLNREGSAWRAVIAQVDWKGLWRTGTLDGNLIDTIEDDACIQGTRPEYVFYQGRWLVATADYGDHGNEVRLMDPRRLAVCKKTSEPGVVVKKFTCAPWVQNLLWIPEKNMLLLIQNKSGGAAWRFTYLDLEKSVRDGKASVVNQVDHIDRKDELEGYTLCPDRLGGIAVTSSREHNVNFTVTEW